MDDQTVPIKNLRNCARCGGDHAELVATKMARPFAPPEAGGLAWTHWLPCPTNGEPVLVIVSDKTEIDELPAGTPRDG